MSPDKTTKTACDHAVVSCVNAYELIRKYRCDACGEVMMCACDEEFARTFLSHQEHEGTELDTKRPVPVTLGYQPGICNTCRRIPEEAHPKAETYGNSSKVTRYYWREIWFETTKRYAKWNQSQSADRSLASTDAQQAYSRIEREVIDEIKEQHKVTPKYKYQEESQQDVLTSAGVEILNLDGTYIRKQQGKAALLHQGRTYTAEEFASLHLEQQGYTVLQTESTPFHALFGIYFWLLVEDFDDPLVRGVGFGERGVFERREEGRTVWARLPEDFGAPGYAQRRAEAIDEHFAKMLNGDREELLWNFDYWLGPSERLRQYLWAHRPDDVKKARQIVSVLPVDYVRRILRYMIASYWERFCGWPDLLAYRNCDFLFLEVKSSGDKLSEDQKRWIKGNAAEIQLPFKLVKIHKKYVIDEPVLGSEG